MLANAPACRGVFFSASFILEKRKPKMVPDLGQIFFRGTREPKAAEQFETAIGLGSMSLILLHHCCSTLICDWTVASYGAKSHARIRIRCDVAMRRHHE
jgi:hypothetical protein